MPYMDSAERAQENQSSAWATLILGGVGLTAVIICIIVFLTTGSMPFELKNSYILYIVGVLSLIFIGMGFVSLKSAKTYAKKAESEKFLQDTILQWCRGNLRAEEINAEAEDYQVSSEEEIYFRRAESIRNRINRQFMNLDQNFLEHFIDETIYDMVFGQQSQE